MLGTVRSARLTLSKSEDKVAGFVLNKPEVVVQASIQSLAKKCGVSEPTVVRFCKAIGCGGYHDFKIRLARSMASKEKFFFRDVDSDDSSQVLSEKLIDSAIASMQNIRNQLDFKAVDAAIELYQAAGRVEFYGSGGSAVVAEDAQLKFFRLGKPAISYADPHIMLASAALLDKDSLAIAISYTGRNRDMLETVAHAQQAGARVLSVTRTGSPLASMGDINLNVDLDEDSDVFSPLKSRLAQMVVLDILAVGVALQGGTEVMQGLSSATLAIADKFV